MFCRCTIFFYAVMIIGVRAGVPRCRNLTAAARYPEALTISEL